MKCTFPGGDAIVQQWAALCQGDLVGTACLTSTSLSHEASASFLTYDEGDADRNIFITLHNVPTALRMWFASAYRGELEALLSPMQCFIVASAPEPSAAFAAHGKATTALHVVLNWQDSRLPPSFNDRVLDDARAVEARLAHLDAEADERFERQVTELQGQIADVAGMLVEAGGDPFARLPSARPKMPTNPLFFGGFEAGRRKSSAAHPSGTIVGGAVVSISDMHDDLQQDVVDCAVHALRQFSEQKAVAQFVKRELDAKYGLQWHVIVGRDFGSYVAHEPGDFSYFFAGDFAFLVWRTARSA